MKRVVYSKDEIEIFFVDKGKHLSVKVNDVRSFYLGYLIFNGRLQNRI